MSRRVTAYQLAAGLAVTLVLALLVSISTGELTTSWADALCALAPNAPRADSAGPTVMVVQQIRLPRALLAVCVGALLGACGAVTQGLFRNPLADPSLIGVTAGASLGASLCIVALAGSTVGVSATVGVSLGAFLGGLLTVILVYRLATGAHGTSVATMLLAGIAITALCGAASNVLELMSSDSELRRISLWRMGGLEAANTLRVCLAFAVCLLVMPLLIRFSSALDALLLGESEARFLGVNISRVKTGLIILVAIGVGGAVALAGTIAFVGLVVPHMVRLLVGPSHRFLIPLSALAGAALLVIADVLARVLFAPSELPVGVVTAAVGVPFFILLLRERRRGAFP